MPRYFLHIIRRSDVIKDLEGSELPDLEAARREAVAGARAILSEEVRGGTLSLDEWIDITDASGNQLLSVPFSSTITIDPHFLEGRVDESTSSEN